MPALVYRAGIIGCGRIADTIEDELIRAPAWSLLPYSHAGAYQRCSRTRLVAAADPNPERLTAFGERRSVDHLYADYREMLDREALDIVSICVPTRSHVRVALDVAERPVKGIYLEKPIAQSLGEADQMIAAFQSRGIKVAVNHLRTWDPTYGAVRRLIAGSAIGSIHTLVAHLREGALFGGTHMYDLVRSLLGAEPEWVFGELEPGTGMFDPGARGIIGFPGGTRVYVNCVDDPVQFELDVIGSEGRIRVGNGLYPELWQVDRSGPQRMLVRRGFPGVHDGRSGMLRAVEDLIAAIETGSKPASNEIDARADLQIAVALHLSHRSGERVRLPVTAPDYVIEDPWGRDR
ncbi:MAG TPA: Gfo/Idh/MocA family oxidoreductase [Chloroflexota bacterium]